MPPILRKKINRPRRAAILPYSSAQYVYFLHQLFSYPLIRLLLRHLRQPDDPGAAFFVAHRLFSRRFIRRLEKLRQFVL